MKMWFVTLAVIALGGCADQTLQNERARLVGYPEPYKDGYVDGCSSGTKAAGNPYYVFKKDVVRFDADKLYGQGWGDGFNVCKAEYQAIQGYMR